VPEVADVLRRYGEAYRGRFDSHMPPSHRRAMEDILACRTEALGGQRYQCDRCGHSLYAYHSCRNRSCPKCHKTDTQRWLSRRQAELLPVPHFHLTFTLPRELHSLVRTHQRLLYGILLKAAALALMSLARDPRFVGGRIGILSVLHTWTRAMVFHPHAHCLVPAGGVSQDDSRWRPAHKKYLVPVQALSILFRAKFIKLARKALPKAVFPESIWKKNWVVHCKPAVQDSAKVLGYLARYVHRIAITNNRILSVGDEKVLFRYKDSRQLRWKTMSLSAEEFLRRFLQHVLPEGFHKVRYFGFLSPSSRSQLPHIRSLIPEDPSCGQPSADPLESAKAQPKPNAPLPCPSCHQGWLILVATVLPLRRAPP